MSDREFVMAFVLARAGAITDSKAPSAFDMTYEAEVALKTINKNYPTTATPVEVADDSGIPF